MPEIKQGAKMSFTDMVLFQINKKNIKTSGEGRLKTPTIFPPPRLHACQSIYKLRHLQQLIKTYIFNNLIKK